MQDGIYLPMINLSPTMKCNLKCQLCGVLVPQYEYRPQMSLCEVKKSLEAIFEIVGHVGKLQITGGEPFIYGKLDKIIEACFAYKAHFDSLWLFTNGTIPLSNEVASILEKHKEKIVVHISDYGVRKEVTQDVVKTLKKIGCEYRYLKYFGEDQYFDGWVDQGDFICHDRDEKALEEVFSNCSHVKRGGSWYVRQGQMHWCGRSIRGTELDKIPKRDEDYLDLFEGSIEERRHKLIKLKERKSIMACQYCNGYYGTEDKAQRHRAGEQIKYA